MAKRERMALKLTGPRMQYLRWRAAAFDLPLATAATEVLAVAIDGQLARAQVQDDMAAWEQREAQAAAIQRMRDAAQEVNRGH